MYRLVAFVVLGVALVGLTSGTIQINATELSGGGRVEKQSTAKVRNLFAKVKTVCIGRFLVDVPVESTLIYGPARVPYLIERLPGKGESFDALIRERVAAINGSERELAYGPLTEPGSLLGQVVNGSVQNQKVVFGVGKAVGAFYEIESYLQVGDDVYIQSLSSPAKQYQKAVAELNEISPLIKSRHEGTVPTEAGICIDGALVTAPNKPIYEYVTLGIRLDPFSGFFFRWN